MNTTNYSSSASTLHCSLTKLPDGGYAIEEYVFSVLAIFLNLSCPVIILLNALVVAAVTTKRRLRSKHNTLLASLAVTDLAVGIAAQPGFIAQEIHFLTGGPPYLTCINTAGRIAYVSTICLCLASCLHLVIVSVERFVAMKYPFRYESVVSKSRLTVAVAGSWLITMVYSILLARIVPGLKVIPGQTQILAIVCLLTISYCHISVYFVCRRHEVKIKSEQVSQEAKAKFLAERKAWKTTSFIIGFAVICYSPGLLRAVAFYLFPGYTIRRIISRSIHLTMSSYMANSLCNPIIYCWRSRKIREALKQLLLKKSTQLVS